LVTRLRLLKGATALLYVGPLFAGISGLGIGMVAPFVAVFIVWLMILRPEQWPATTQEWLSGSAWGAALTQLLSQVLLVSILLAVGRGIGAIAGYLPTVNPVFPLAVSFMAIPLCRMLWDAREAAEAGIFLDDEAEAAHAPRAAAEAASAIVPLLNLSDAAPDADVAQTVARTLDVPGAALRIKALSAALTQPDRSHAALRRALVLWASEPEIVAPALVPDSMAFAFSLSERNPDLLRLYLPRAIALISAFPDRAAGFPTPDRLRQTQIEDHGADPASRLPAHLLADLRDGLQALALAVERALAARPAAPDLRREPVTQSEARHA
jgi:hypothetical protein